MSAWRELAKTLLTEQDKQVFELSGYGNRGGFGRRPVLLVIDVTYGFCGQSPEPILDAVRRGHNSCGDVAWDAIVHIERLIAAARSRRLPVFYTTGFGREVAGTFGMGRWLDKCPAERETQASPVDEQIVAPIAPQPHDIVIERAKPSAFFGTLLAAYLADLGADSIIACGVTTSGCVRASVVDGFSYNYKMILVEDATFDRSEVSHAINLSDMDLKYADVLPAADVVEYVQGLPDDLFVDRMPILGEVPVERVG